MTLLMGALSRAAALLPRVFSRAMSSSAHSENLGNTAGRYRSTSKRPIMGRAFRGLYDGKHIMFGNQISFAGNKRVPLLRPAARARPASLAPPGPASPLCI